MLQTEMEASTILVVDDDFTMRLLMREALEQAGFHVIEAENGEEALQLFISQNPSIILSDILMPEMNGFELCTQVRAHPRGQFIPILLVTGLDDSDSIDHAYDVGATDFLTKPITWALLGHHVHYILRAARTVEDLSESQKRLAHAQAIAHLGNWQRNFTTDSIFWSDEVFTILEVDKNTYIPDKNTFYETIHPDDQERVRLTVLDAAKRYINYTIEYRLCLFTGKEKVIYEQGEATWDTVNQHLILTGTIQDITERKRVENELTQYRDNLENLVAQRTTELQEANDALQNAKEEAEQATRLKDKFVSLVAHDLRSPLSGILGAIEYVCTDADYPLYDEHQEVLHSAMVGINALSQMIEDVLKISRLKTGKLVPEIKYFTAHTLINEVIDKLSYLANKKQIQLINDVPEDYFLQADRTLIGEVIQNIASNALKFSYAKSTVHFYAIDKGTPSLAIKDTGKGVPAHLQDKLFNIDEKTSMLGTAGETGTGFGLPFSQDIMLAHNGSLQLESKEGEGTIFFVNFPNPQPEHIKAE